MTEWHQLASGLLVPLTAFFPLLVTQGQSGTPTTQYDSGDRTGSITITDQIVNTGVSANTRLVNGNEGATSANSCQLLNAYRHGDFIFDWGSGAKKIVDAFNFKQSSSQSHGTAWEVWASSNMDDWVQLKSAFTLGGAAGDNIVTWTNINAYRAYRIINRDTADTDQTSSTPWMEEIYFKIANGSSQHSVDNTIATYGNKGGVGARTSLITITTTATTGAGGGAITALLDGKPMPNAGEGNTQSWFWSNGQSGREIKCDFGASYSPKITEASWWQSGTQTHGTWKWAGSNDDSSYTDLVTGITLGGAKLQTHAIASTVAYRYYKLIQTAGTTNSGPWLRELEFKLKV